MLLSPGVLFSQNVTIKMNNGSFSQLSREIQKQTSLTFLYNDAVVSGITGLNLDFVNTNVSVVLERALRNSGIDFSIVDNTVVLRKVQSPPPPPIRHS